MEHIMINEEKALINAMRQAKDRNERRRIQRKIKKIHTDEKQTYDKLFLDAKDKSKNMDISALYEIGLINDEHETEEDYIKEIFGENVRSYFSC
jgi:hypothetical protein